MIVTARGSTPALFPPSRLKSAGLSSGWYMPYWKLYYHFVFGTKNRLPLIDLNIERELYRVLVAKAQKMGGFVHAIGGMDDHAHMAVSIPPNLPVRNL